MIEIQDFSPFKLSGDKIIPKVLLDVDLGKNDITATDNTVNGLLSALGLLKESYWVTATNGYVIGTNSEIVAISSGFCLSMFLPNVIDKSVYTVINGSDSDNLVVGTNDAALINGTSAISLNPRECATFICDGTNWYISSISTSSVASDENFSYNEIVVDKTIPQYQQMAVFGELILEAELIINGQLVMEN